MRSAWRADWTLALTWLKWRNVCEARALGATPLTRNTLKLDLPLPARSSVVGRGVACIVDAVTQEMEFPHVQTDGSVVMKREMVIRVFGQGTLSWAMTQTWWVDMEAVFCNSVREVQNTFGIFAAQQTLFEELRGVMRVLPPLNSMHAHMVASFQCVSGSFLALNRHGVFSDRTSTSSVLSQSAFERASDGLTSAALSRIKESIGSVTSALLTNCEIGMGTGAVSLRIPKKDAHCIKCSSDGGVIDDAPILSVCRMQWSALQGEVVSHTRPSVAEPPAKRQCTYRAPEPPAPAPVVNNIQDLFNMLPGRVHDP